MMPLIPRNQHQSKVVPRPVEALVLLDATTAEAVLARRSVVARALANLRQAAVKLLVVGQTEIGINLKKSIWKSG